MSQSPWRCWKFRSQLEVSESSTRTASRRLWTPSGLPMYANNLTIGIDKIINRLCLGASSFELAESRATLGMMDLWRVMADKHLPDNVGPNYSRLQPTGSVLHVIAACLNDAPSIVPLSMAKAINISPSREINLRLSYWRWKFQHLNDERYGDPSSVTVSVTWLICVVSDASCAHVACSLKCQK